MSITQAVQRLNPQRGAPADRPGRRALAAPFGRSRRPQHVQGDRLSRRTTPPRPPGTGGP